MSSDVVYAAVEWPKNAEGKNATASPALAEVMVQRFVDGVKNVGDPSDVQFWGDPELEPGWQQDIIDRYAELVRSLFESDRTPWGVSELYFSNDLHALVTTEDTSTTFDAIEIVRNLGITLEPVAA